MFFTCRFQSRVNEIYVFAAYVFWGDEIGWYLAYVSAWYLSQGCEIACWAFGIFQGGGALVIVAPFRSMLVVMFRVPAAVTGLLGRNPGCFLVLNPVM
jgi:hypothetical protein